ncbi:MAG: methyltransferase domain-containing protein [Luteitalea sp.]|nr:methyltransferase domain-containing protein [Luteitalea sp.]
MRARTPHPLGILSAVLAGIALTAAVEVGGAAAVTAQSPARRPAGESLAPYAPTPHDVVDRMLTLAGVTKRDVLYDLGSGDGRLVIQAAKQYGARGVGIDIDPDRIAESRTNARQVGVEALVEFRLEDALAADISDATVVTLYLLSSSNLKLRPKLQRELEPGTRIVSHNFSMGGEWKADKVDEFTDSNGSTRVLYLWTIK